MSRNNIDIINLEVVFFFKCLIFFLLKANFIKILNITTE